MAEIQEKQRIDQADVKQMSKSLVDAYSDLKKQLTTANAQLIRKS
jgi:hypothetical protein